ncbi:hypothetical protein Bca101_071926 [Brassica carinata]
MTSRRKASSKSHRDRSVPGGSSLQHGNIAPKVEFSDHSIDPEERDAYWTARGEPKRRAPGIWCPAPFPANPVEGCPNAICTIQLGPRPNKAIIADFVSNYRVWMQFLFFFPIDNASVEESCIPILRTRWGWRESNPFPPASDGLNTIIGLLCSGDFYWATFTPKRVRHAVALNRSRFHPDLPIEEEDEPSMDGFIPCEAPVERSRNRKSKHIVVDDDEVGGGCFPETLVGNYFDGELFDLEELLGSNPPEAEVGSDKGPEFTKASRLVNGFLHGLLVMNRALDASIQDASIQQARMAKFRAEKADKEIAHLTNELERSQRDEGRLVATEIRRAHRRGRREMAEIMKTRRDQFSYEFGELKEVIKLLGIASATAETIHVSPDTVEAETGVPDERGEVNQPVAPLNVDDYLVGGSMTGYFNIDG